MYGPLPATPGHFLSVHHHAGAVCTAAPWSAAVLAACHPTFWPRSHPYGYCRLAELKYFASSHNPPVHWGVLSAGQVACKLLIMWKVWFWPHWSALPYPEFHVLDPDPQSFDQYNVPPLHDDGCVE